jgi:ABC-type arginine transport system permease subunit
MSVLSHSLIAATAALLLFFGMYPTPVTRLAQLAITSGNTPAAPVPERGAPARVQAASVAR